ncbi:MAG: methylmalonyl Co-A mutase-associated GTPase MeaB [Planctomycetes bacterium]|nr:methylmalonyl Co-A mutase-associated GTPase MeaB [Planctomycetota bacterium]
MLMQMDALPGPAELADAIRNGNRGLLARAITLVESQRPRHQQQAQELLQLLLPQAGAAHRIGVTGVPGVGKSTFLERFGMQLLEHGHRVAVLAVDPSSSLNGGSILGDKARMHHLAQHANAFIRPSPSGNTLGGVARRTRESMMLCEAAGFDVVLVETVGVGQSETMVAQMVDFFLVLMLPGAGDELQGIKKGILELADVIAVNKADGDNQVKARIAVRDYSAALHYLRARSAHWQPSAMAVSGLEGVGLDELWQLILQHKIALTGAGEWEQNRAEQRSHWLWEQIEERLLTAFRSNRKVQAKLSEIEAEVMAQRLPATQGAMDLLAAFFEADEEASN